MSPSSLSGENITRGDCAIEGTLMDVHGCMCADADAETMKVYIGIAIHIVGSVGINCGQNLQAMALVKMPEGERTDCLKLIRQRLWLIGIGLFISSSIVNFLMLMLAPAMILVPLEAVQFIVNVAWGKFVNKVAIPPRMIIGTLLMCLGIAQVVIFGERGIFCFEEQDLKNFWRMPAAWGWWIYILITFSISAVCLVFHSRYDKLRKAGGTVPHEKLLMPFLYATPSALLGGGQMIVQSKCLSELLEIMGKGDQGNPDYVTPLAGWFLYVEILLVCGFGMFWFYRLSTSLGMYDPLFIIPLMQSFFMMFGGVAGGIFFHEFTNLHVGLLGYGNWCMYILGLVVVVYGLYLVRPVAEGESSGMSTSAPARVSPGSKPLQKDGGTPNKLDEGSVSTISHDTEVVAFAHDADVVAFAASTSTAIEAGVMTGIALKSAADRPVEAMPITTARHVEVEDVTEFDEMDLEELEMVEPATEL